MDATKRKMTKIARELNKLVLLTTKEAGVGTAEIDIIHFVRHHPGCTQAEIREALKIDKGAAARRTMNLEAKGYLSRRENPDDGRSRLLFPTDQAQHLRNSKADVEGIFYEWLLAELTEQEKQGFVEILDRLYLRSKKESRAGFPEVLEWIRRREAKESGTADALTEAFQQKADEAGEEL